MNAYLADHPKADPKNHSVVKSEDGKKPSDNEEVIENSRASKALGERLYQLQDERRPAITAVSEAMYNGKPVPKAKAREAITELNRLITNTEALPGHRQSDIDYVSNLAVNLRSFL